MKLFSQNKCLEILSKHLLYSFLQSVFLGNTLGVPGACSPCSLRFSTLHAWPAYNWCSVKHSNNIFVGVQGTDSDMFLQSLLLASLENLAGILVTHFSFVPLVHIIFVGYYVSANKQEKQVCPRALQLLSVPKTPPDLQGFISNTYQIDIWS